MLPAMVNFSRLGICKGITINQGKRAKKKSTTMVEAKGRCTGQHFSALHQFKWSRHTAEKIRSRPCVDGAVAPLDAAVVDVVDGNA